MGVPWSTVYGDSKVTQAKITETLANRKIHESSIFSSTSMSSIFNQIFRYRPREHRTPREDYFTEILAAVLERSEALRVAWAAWLARMECSEIRSVRIETQRGFTVEDGGTGRRPDMWFETIDASKSRHGIIVENKIDSGEGENQLADYARILKRDSGLKSRTLVFITKFPFEPDFCANSLVEFKHLKWSDVYHFLRNEPLEDIDGSELAVELLKLMEDWNMNGTVSAAQLRAAITCFDSEVGRKLHAIQDEAWASSGIGTIISDNMNGKKWTYDYQRGSMTASEIPGLGIKLYFGFRFDRRDEGWDVDKIELPSPVVTVSPSGTNWELGESLSQPSEHWTGPIQDMSPNDKWVRQPVHDEMPRLGEPLDECYRTFFHNAFVELKLALEGTK